MSNLPEDDAFLQEVKSLFALEGQEWLAQIDQAVGELTASAPADRAAVLLDTIAKALTNLGGSAATVGLGDIEQVATALVPLVKAMARGGGSSPPPAQWAALVAGLKAIGGVVAALAEQREPTPIDVPGLQAVIETAGRREAGGVSAWSKLRRLHAVVHEGTRGGAPMLIDRVIEHLENKGAAAKTNGEVDGAAVRLVLEEADRVGQQLYDAAKRLAPGLRDQISKLAGDVRERGLDAARVEQILRDARSLHESAAKAGAQSVQQACQGLELFVRVVSRGSVSASPRQFDAVQRRIGDLVPDVQRWVDGMRAERAAIEEVLAQA